ncbi:GNAT family N-acetyltransferase [Pseudomonas sp. Hg3Tf]|uniref:GNAT family N-acetyltransferase n=1 Tax=Pseudomonas sp. Hg3Tf TaxID=3342569 RepID=UPI0005EB0FBF|nr:GNAT family N-acetyltransferase [Pseudomonas sp. Hg5Tf]
MRDLAVQLTDYRDLSQTQRDQLIDIEVHPEQRHFAGDISSALYILLSVDSDDMRGVVVLLDSVPQAFLLLQRGAFLPAWAEADAAMLSALQVDRRQQGQGLGRFCMTALPSLVRTVWPDVGRLQLSVDLDNHAALAFYQATGWTYTGDGYRARRGFERQMTLLL